MLPSIEPMVSDYTDWFNDLVEHLKALVGRESKFSGEYGDENLTGEESEDILSETMPDSPENDPT